MNKALFLIILLMISSVPSYCINHLDVIHTIIGEFDGAEMGYSLASLDFNGDGFMDLAVLERGWNPLGHVNNPDTLYWGKILF
jgi:hypothetical protein